MERLADPILSDIDIEWRECVKSGRPRRARWVVVRGYVGLARALALHGLNSCARGAVSDPFYALTFFGITAMAHVVSPAIAAWLPTAGLALASVVLLRARQVSPSSGH
jgi:hypothetical protein